MRILIDDVRFRFRMLRKKQTFPFVTAVHLAFIFLIMFVFVITGFARERGPRVEVVCLSPPIPVRIDKQQVLVYELHVTNFDTVPLTLKRVEVFANEESSEPLITLSDEALSAQMMRVGAAMAMAMPTPGSGATAKDARVIEPGGRS